MAEVKPLPLKELLRRIEAKTEKTQSCWLWMGARHGRGYGIIADGRRQLAVHRVLWDATYGPASPRSALVPRCGIDYCVRPEHRRSGNRQSGHRGASIARARAARNVFTWQEVLILMGLRRLGWTSTRLAEVFAAKRGTVIAILRGQSWRWLTGLGKRQGRYDHYAGSPYNARGERAAGHTLGEWHVTEIARRRRAGQSASAIAAALHLNINTVKSVFSGHTWKWLTGLEGHHGPLIGSANGRARLSDDQVREAHVMKANGATIIAIAQHFEMSYSATRSLLAGETWCHLQPSPHSQEEPHPDEALVYQHWKGGRATDA